MDPLLAFADIACVAAATCLQGCLDRGMRGLIPGGSRKDKNVGAAANPQDSEKCLF